MRQGLSLNLKLIHLASLTEQHALGVLRLPPCGWDYRLVPQHLALCVGAVDLNLGLHTRWVNALLTEPSLYPLCMCFV